MKMRTMLAATLAALLLCAACSAAGDGAAKAPATVTVQDAAWAVSADADAANPDIDALNGTVLVAKSGDDGTTALAVVRLPLPGGITADQVRGAWLELRHKEGGEPSLRVGVVTKSWSSPQMSWNTIRDGVSFSGAASGEATEDGWYRYEVADIVRAWLSGERANYGFAIEPDKNGVDTTMYSTADEDAASHPRLIIEYEPSSGGEAHGKYDFAYQEAGNCLSYALRDTDGVFLDALIDDFDAFNAAIAEGKGLPRFADAFEAYVAAHMDDLAIASFRAVTADEAIDTEREYRIAMRVGAHEYNGVEGIQAENRDFDYHFRVQLRDGSWAEKFPQEGSRVVPGSNADNSLNQFLWDSSYQMGNEKWNEYYDSDVLYYAVEKSTDEFTAHLDGE